jgi:hypothetical protein
MRLEIDNFDGAGVCDYTEALDAEAQPKIVRRLNRPATMSCGLVVLGALTPPVTESRIAWRLDTGTALFTGYVTQAERVYLGWNESGPVYRYVLTASGDEEQLDRQVFEVRPALVEKSAGAIVRELLPAGTDVVGVKDCGTIAQLDPSLRKWSECAAEAANQARAAYSALDGKVALRSIGERSFTIDESDPNFAPDQLALQSPDRLVNDIIVLGKSECDAHVKDYFLGDGSKLSFSLSASPFGNKSNVVFEQEYTQALDPAWWTLADPNGVTSMSSGYLWVQGGGASIQFAEQFELGGALQFQHGDVMFQAPSDGVIGGLYDGASLIAGFQIQKSGSQSTITAVVNGNVTGTPMNTQENHRYLFTTRVYASEAVRRAGWYRSSKQTLGGDDHTAEVRMVLEVHEVNGNDLASLLAPATVLYDGLVANVPSFCSYTLLQANDMHCSVAYSRLLRLANVCVRSALPGQAFRTRLVGAMMDGGECNVGGRSLTFYSADVPAPNEQIVVEYRNARAVEGRAKTAVDAGRGRPASIVCEVVSPTTRTSDDCANAAQAMLDDTMQQAWIGKYRQWSDFLPGDIWPGDVLHVNAPSRECVADVVVREVEIESVDPANERSRYALKFANEAAEPIAVATRAATLAQRQKTALRDPGTFCLPGLPQAQVTNITSTQVTIDTGCDPIAGGGFEVRLDDSGWGPLGGRNLVIQLNSRVITVPRLSRVVSYWIRQYDSTARYSRWATLLHVDYPYD